jgi:hypothetical protein
MKKGIHFLITAALIVWGYQSWSQCNVVNSGTIANPTNCGSLTTSLGPGEAKTLTVSPNTIYNFTISGTTTYVNGSTPICIGGTGYASNTNWNSGANTSIVIGTNRSGTSIGWSGWAVNGGSGSAVITYKRVTPTVSASLSVATICSGTGITLSSSGSNGTISSWTGTANGTYTNNIASPAVSNITTGGSYTVTYANGTCTNSATTGTLTVNAQPTITGFTKSDAGTFCTGGSGTIAVNTSGGTPGGLTYSWTGSPTSPASGAATATIGTGTLTPSSQTTYTYNVTVTDAASGCNDPTSSTTIIVYPDPVVTTPTGGTICKGGTITLNGAVATDGVPSSTYLYKWRNNGLDGVGTTPTGFTHTNATTQNLTVATTNSSAPATYNYLYYATQSQSGCSAALSGNVGVVVNDDPSITLSAYGNTKQCVDNGPGIVLSAAITGGTSQTYQWQWIDSSSGVSPNYTPRDITGKTSSTFNPNTLTTTASLQPAIWANANGYGFRVRTASAVSGCDAATSANWVQVSPVPLAASTNGVTTVSGCGAATVYAAYGTYGTTCRFYDGAVDASVEGTGGSYTITNAGSTPIVKTIRITSYNATTGCETAAGNAVVVTVTVNPTFTATVSNSNFNGFGVSCASGSNGSITASVTSTSFPITYAWSNGTTNSVNAASNTITNLGVGAYNVTMTDAAGCVTTQTTTLAAPTQLSNAFTESDYNGFNISCNGSSTGSLTAAASGGVSTYTYGWSTGTGGATISSRPAGTYTVTITDANNCTLVESNTLNQPGAVSLTYLTGYVCSGSTYTSGIITITPSGGVAPYTYSRDGVNYVAGNQFTGLANGSTHSLKVKDANGCMSTVTPATVTFPANGSAVGDCNYIYVADYGDPTGTLGTKSCPVSLPAAISIYNSNTTRNHIVMLAGTYSYNAKITIPANVTVDGGYSINGSGEWVKSTNTATNVTINPSLEISSASGTQVGYYIGLEAGGNGFTLKDITFNVLPGGASGVTNRRGRSVYGLYENGKTGFLLSRCTINTGAGSSGDGGDAIGGSGGAGGGGYGGGYGSTYSSDGGCDCNSQNGSNGGSGSGGAGGGGGGARCCGSGCNIFDCDAGPCTASPGGNGSPGAAGFSYSAGNRPANNTGSSILVFYTPQTGSAGGNGSGGGGGGGGGGGDDGTCCSCSCGGGGAEIGGNGGAGGGGGVGGNGGFGGGASIAIYAWGGSGTITDCALNAGSGGTGGAGNAGQAGAGGNGGGAGNYRGGCDGGRGGNGGTGGAGGAGGRGQDGANGLSQGLVTGNSASITQSGSSVPNDGIVTANTFRGCTNSEIVLTKTSGSGWSISSDPTFTKNQTNTSTGYSNSDNTISIYFTTTGTKDIVIGGTTLKNFIRIYNTRTPPSINSITAPCAADPITLGTSYTADQYEWKISNVATPTTYVYTSSTQNPGTVSAPSGGWVPGATYQARLRVYENCCGWSIPVYLEFTIKTVPSATSAITASDNIVCANQTGVTYDITSVAGVNYTWAVSGGTITAGQSTNQITVSWGGAGSGSVQVTPSNSCGNGTPTISSITINQNPTATINVTPSASFCSGGSATLTAAGQTGGGQGNGTFTYLWSTTSTSTAISVSTANTFTVTVTEGLSGCVGTNSATTIILPSPSILTQPSAPAAVCSGSGVRTITVAAIGDGLTYQWRKGGSPVSNSATISGAGTATITFTNAAVGDAGSYDVVVSGTCSPSVTSNAVTFTVNPTPVASVVSNASPICSGSQTAIVLSSTVGGTTYDWSRTNTGAVTGTASATGAAGPINVALSRTGAQASTIFTITPKAGGCTGADVTATVAVNESPNGALTGSTTICSGGSATLTFNSSAGTGNYNIVYTGGSQTGIANGGTFSVSPSSATTYTLSSITDANGCTRSSGFGTSATVSVDQPSVGGTLTPSSQTTCGASGAISSISLSGNTGAIVQWEIQPPSGSYAAASPSGAGSATSPQNTGFTTTGTYNYRVQVKNGVCAVAYSTSAAIVVDAASVAGTIGAAGNGSIICDGTSTVITTAGSTGSSYNWQRSPNGSSGWVSQGTTTIPQFSTGILAQGNYYYRVVVTNGTCAAATSGNIVINVTAPITNNSIASAQSVCSGGTPSQITGSTPAGGNVFLGYTYLWQESTDNATWASAAGTNDGINYTPSVPLTSNIFYRRKVTSGNCEDNSVSVQISIVANPVAQTINGSPAPGQVCTGTSVSATFSGGSGGGGTVTDTYEVSISGGAWNAYTPGSSISTTSLSGANAVQIRTRRTATGSNCPASSYNTVSWSVDTKPVATLVSNTASICSGSSTAIALSSDVPGSSFSWTRTNTTNVTGTNSATGAGSPIAVTLSATSSQTTQFSITAVAPAGCTSDPVIVNVTIVPALNVTVSEVSNDLTGCSGDTFALVASASGGTGTPSYQWQRYISGVWSNVGANASTFNTGPVVNTSSSAIIASYRVIYSTSGSGCGNITSSQLDITIQPKPTAEPEFDDCVALLAGTKYSYIILTNGGSAPPFHVDDSTNLGAVRMYSDMDTTFVIYRLPQDGTNAEYVFTTTDANGCSVTSTFSRETTYPQTIVTTSTSGNTVNECQLKGWNEWEHFQNPNNKNEVIMSVNPNGVDLGKVTVTSYVDAPGISVMNNSDVCNGIAQAAMRRHYKITSSAFAPGEAFTNGSNVGVRLYFSDADFTDLSGRAAANDGSDECTTDDNITDMTQLFVTKYSDNTSSGTENGTYSDNDPAAGIYKVFGPARPASAATYAGPLSAVQDNGFDAVFSPGQPTGHNYIDLDVTEFSEFWLHGSQSGSPLPVKMLFVEAKAIENTFIRVEWATSTEIDNWKFEVERSENGTEFKKIGEVIGHATSTERNDYLYNDLTVKQGVRYYYRLKQIDFDGKYEYTPIVSAKLNVDDDFRVGEFVPNPTSGRSTLTFKTKSNKDVTVKVVNYLGALVMEQNKTIRNADNSMYFDFDKLAAGTYMITINTAEKNYSRRVVLTR